MSSKFVKEPHAFLYLKKRQRTIWKKTQYASSGNSIELIQTDDMKCIIYFNNIFEYFTIPEFNEKPNNNKLVLNK